MTFRRLIVALVTLLVTAGVMFALLRGGSATTAVESADSPAAQPSASAGTTAPDASEAPAGPSAPPATQETAPPTAVLAPAEPIAPVSAQQLAARIATAGTVKGRLGAVVVDVGTGATLYGRDAARAMIPASTNKLATGAAALSLLGPDHRFTTKVVSAKADRVVLVGGGDPYLAGRRAARAHPERASLADLAARTSRAVLAKKQRKVTVAYDTSLFPGAAWNPQWPATYGDQVTRTSALWVDEGRVSGSPGPRVADPARTAAAAFAAELKRHGVTATVSGRAKAPRGAAQLAAVRSMPLDRIVEQTLLVSDNDAAEVLFRQAGVAAKKSGSIVGGQQAVAQQLQELGVWRSGEVAQDGSGLSRETKVPASTLARLLRLAALPEHVELRALITGLPVAGVEGSLRGHYSDDETLPARGLVRGKTGTLRQVHSLAGFVRTTDGSMLVYAFIVNDARDGWGAKVWLDKVTAAISSCGCR